MEMWMAALASRECAHECGNHTCATHAHTTCLLSVHIGSRPCGNGCRHPDCCFGLLALTSAMQPSKTPTRLLNPIYTIDQHPAGPCNLVYITGLPSNVQTIYPHIKGHSAPLAYHTHLHHHTHVHTPALTALCNYSVSHANATCAAHRYTCICTFIYTQHMSVARLHINTQHICMHTHKT